jgi:S-adenosyl-L-methionine hydrolase (adenosine-forming)
VLITVTSDFAKQSQGVAMMEAVVAEIAPDARLIHYMHGLDDFDTISAARVLETVRFVAPAIHVCICDPGVGTSRRPLALLTQRGDVLIGPDNGVLLPAALALGGVREAREITNMALMRHPVSAVFHGRDVFCPAAAHLANGVGFEVVGEMIEVESLAPPPYEDAERADGLWRARIIFVDKFGNAHLNIHHDEWQSGVPASGSMVDVALPDGQSVAVSHHSTFGETRLGAALILADNDGRPTLALNRGSFASTHGLSVGDEVVVAPRLGGHLH